jgi:hypothetical protein
MAKEKLQGTGRLVPTRLTGVEYKVKYGIEHIIEEVTHGGTGGFGPGKGGRWAKCSVRPTHSNLIPDGSYFLHADDGRVHQLRSMGGQWQCLSLA